MKIAVLTKEVPDTWGDRTLDLETGLIVRGAGERVLDEICERALELAMSHADANEGTEVVVVMMAPAEAAASVRRALALGASSAVHIVDPELVGADLGLTAEVLAAAVRRVGADLVITGDRSTDGGGGVLAAMLAEHLRMPHLTGLSSVTISDGEVSGTRITDASTALLSATLPAVVSVTEALPDARMASFKNIIAAKKKLYETVSVAELGVSVDPGASAYAIVTAAAAAPPRAAGTTITDEGDAGIRLAQYLIENRLA
ncbi:electron transfer flavoprotein subunit beta/FixA family protein [Microbacterium radiodurans]|uniref:Electron transfer flavoprotein subunit beta/FixA family protein n=1 Tax=Microbacterium radiodurans TaxID=661398 RepID=A0A5J5IY04_9MICO|nr:electron transfer flavoprotein subunit beta/FixA family protein [Microbacterium radiodurans]KAA9089695.1 electron transfer flavoprotein subunit beta/FixA family protein [Microbacterium radiodurans]